jgi:hypothetical protein
VAGRRKGGADHPASFTAEDKNAFNEHPTTTHGIMVQYLIKHR